MTGRLEGRVAIVTGGAAIAVEADVTDEASCNDMVAAAVAAYGKLDIMVSNAGLYTHLERKDFTELDRRVWEQVMAASASTPSRPDSPSDSAEILGEHPDKNSLEPVVGAEAIMEPIVRFRETSELAKAVY